MAECPAVVLVLKSLSFVICNSVDVTNLHISYSLCVKSLDGRLRTRICILTTNLTIRVILDPIAGPG